MYCNLCLALVVLIGPALSDKSSPETAGKTAGDTDSYENGVGTSFTVPLNPQIVPAVSKNARKYSVSGDDLERSDLSLSPSHPVYSYSAPVNNLDTYVAPNTAGVDVAEARDGAGGHHHHHHAEHAAQEPAAAPAASYQQPAAAETSYQQPVSTGNLYYYYYPVAAYPLDEKNDSDELDPLVLVLLPVTIIVGLLALLSIFNVSVTGRGGRSFQSKSEVYGSVDQLKAKIDTLLENYYLALESESCMDRVVCELGTQATNLSGKTLLMSALDWFTPAPMQSRIQIFKDAANEGYPVHVCKSKYYCHSQNLIQTRRK